ncbi:MAG: hypothetical protein Q9205_001735 [Flavoplaca limonia]
MSSVEVVPRTEVLREAEEEGGKNRRIKDAEKAPSSQRLFGAGGAGQGVETVTANQLSNTNIPSVLRTCSFGWHDYHDLSVR